jgi:hypothetical protein
LFVGCGDVDDDDGHGARGGASAYPSGVSSMMRLRQRRSQQASAQWPALCYNVFSQANGAVTVASDQNYLPAPILKAPPAAVVVLAESPTGVYPLCSPQQRMWRNQTALANLCIMKNEDLI